MSKRIIAFIVCAIVMAVLIVIAVFNFNARYNAQPETITCEMTLKEINDEKYYIYDNNGKDFIILKREIDKFNLPDVFHITVTMQKTNNLLLYLESALNQNASTMWRNGILFIIGDIYEQ